MKTKLLFILLGLLGFSGCNKTGEETPPAPEYGSPYITYKISGKVTDASGVPIKGIAAAVSLSGGSSATDAQGNYACSGQADVIGEFTLTFTDTDGPDNGGDFESKTVEVKMTEADKTGGMDGWKEGDYAKTVDVTLTEKTSE